MPHVDKDAQRKWHRDYYQRVRKSKLQERKQYLVDLRGGCCERCGYDRYLGALDFHHLDASTKEFSISDTMRALEKDLEELEKCILLCANCHREAHGAFV